MATFKLSDFPNQREIPQGVRAFNNRGFTISIGDQAPIVIGDVNEVVTHYEILTRVLFVDTGATPPGTAMQTRINFRTPFEVSPAQPRLGQTIKWAMPASGQLLFERRGFVPALVPGDPLEVEPYGGEGEILVGGGGAFRETLLIGGLFGEREVP